MRELEKLIGDTGTELERVLAYYKVASLGEMTETAYQRAIEIMVDQEIGNMLLSKKPVAQVQEAAETRVNKLLEGVR